jgi:DNA transformation protein
MFALVADDCLYFKVDDADRAEYEELGLAPFGYARKDGRRIAIASFFPVPADALEDPERLGEWSDKALAAARRAGAVRAGHPRSASRS